MKELIKFLSRKSVRLPNKGSLGQPTDWLPILKLKLTNKGVLISDFQFIPSRKDGLVVRLPPGVYGVEVKGMSFAGDRRIASVRVIKNGTNVKRGRKLGETWVDTGATAFCDFANAAEAWKLAGKVTAEEKLQDEYEKCADCGVFRLSKSGVPIPYFSSGFGDGTFPVFELCVGRKRIGVEVEFIAADTRYPFDPQTHSTASSQPDKEEAKQSGADPERERFMQVFRRLQARALTTTFLPAAKGEWLQEEAVRLRTEALLAAGFRRIGCFQSKAVTSLRAAFVHRAKSCFATILKMKSGSFLVINYRCSDGTEVEFTDFALPASQVIPPWIRAVSKPQLPPQELITAAEQMICQEGLKPRSLENYAELCEESWRRITAWLAEIGGQPATYLKDSLHLSDSAEDLRKLEFLRRDEADGSLCNWLRLQPNLPFKVDDILVHIVIVHDDLTPATAQAAWMCGTNDIGVKEAAFQGESPREIFAEVNRQHGHKLKLVWQKQRGFPADFYLPA